MQTAKERIMLFLETIGIGQGKFEKTVGLSNGYVNKLKSSPSIEMMRKIVGTFPQLNPDWLMTGNGEMLRPIPANQSIGNNNHHLQDVNVVKTGMSEAYETLLKIVEAHQHTTDKFQEQTSQLIEILKDNMQTIKTLINK